MWGVHKILKTLAKGDVFPRGHVAVVAHHLHGNTSIRLDGDESEATVGQAQAHPALWRPLHCSKKKKKEKNGLEVATSLSTHDNLLTSH